MQTLHKMPLNQNQSASSVLPVFEIYNDRLEIGFFPTPGTKNDLALLFNCSVCTFYYNKQTAKNAIKQLNLIPGTFKYSTGVSHSNSRYRVATILKLYDLYKGNLNNQFLDFAMSTNNNTALTANLDSTATWNKINTLQLNFVIRDTSFISWLLQTHPLKVIECGMENKSSLFVLPTHNVKTKAIAATPNPTVVVPTSTRLRANQIVTEELVDSPQLELNLNPTTSNSSEKANTRDIKLCVNDMYISADTHVKIMNLLISDPNVRRGTITYLLTV